ncbi:hypothetical protein CLU79DRAFT_782266 [Phycomyces nitens]|nr:hypothetical protein CLU79DRAFT_782266 [Phycomyces nitens]
MDLEYESKADPCDQLINRVVKDLFSFSNTRQKRILDYYYFPEADFVSPLLTTKGVFNIRHVLLLWKTLNKREPTVKNVCFNGQTCVVYLTQHLSPRLVPFISLDLQVMVTLSFKETEVDSGLLKIERHEESWTVEGLFSSVPLLSFWYDRVLRVMMGKFMSTTGEILHLATETAQVMAQRSQEIELNGRQLANASAAQRSRLRKAMKSDLGCTKEGTKSED